MHFTWRNPKEQNKSLHKDTQSIYHPFTWIGQISEQIHIIHLYLAHKSQNFNHVHIWDQCSQRQELSFLQCTNYFFPHPLSNIAFDSECFCIWCAAFVFNISTVFSIFASQLASTRKKSAPREKKPEKICAGHWGSWYLKTLLFRKWTFLLQKMMINENSLAIWDVPLYNCCCCFYFLSAKHVCRRRLILNKHLC